MGDSTALFGHRFKVLPLCLLGVTTQKNSSAALTLSITLTLWHRVSGWVMCARVFAIYVIMAFDEKSHYWDATTDPTTGSEGVHIQVQQTKKKATRTYGLGAGGLGLRLGG